MKGNIVLPAIVAGAFAVTPLAAQHHTETQQPVTVGIASKNMHVVHGIVFQEHPVIQPYASLSLQGITISGAAAYTPHERKFTEGDLGAAIVRQFGHTQVEAGYNLFGLRHGATQEIAAGVRHGLLDARVAHDFGRGSGQYGEFGVSTPHWPVHARASAGVNRRYFRPETGLSAVELEAAAPLRLLGIDFTPSVAYSHDVSGHHHNHRIYGLAASKKF
jgi:hypothetical protein